MTYIPDPDDFVDDMKPEGTLPGQGVTKSGKEGVGGLSTREAEEAYKAAADQHFRDETAGKKIERTEGPQPRPQEHGSLPQIGSLDDEEIREDDIR